MGEGKDSELIMFSQWAPRQRLHHILVEDVSALIDLLLATIYAHGSRNAKALAVLTAKVRATRKHLTTVRIDVDTLFRHKHIRGRLATGSVGVGSSRAPRGSHVAPNPPPLLPPRQHGNK